MNPEIELNDLKTNFWRNAPKNTASEVEYDAEIDTLTFYFDDPGKGVVATHYLDENVSILIRVSDKEIVGFSIEGFERSFASKYANHKPWHLSQTGIALPGVKEFKFVLVREEETRLSLPIKNIQIEKEIKLQPEFAFM